jgi:hypothetical protein
LPATFLSRYTDWGFTGISSQVKAGTDMGLWGSVELLERRTLLSAASDIITADRAQLAFDQAAAQSTLAADRVLLVDDLTMRAHGDPSLVAKLKGDIAGFTEKFRADRQAIAAVRTADAILMQSDRGSATALAADRHKLRDDLASLQAVLNGDKADRSATVRQDQLAIAASRANADASVIKGDLTLLAADQANAAAAVKGDLEAIKTGTVSPGLSNAGTASGGGLFLGYRDVGGGNAEVRNTLLGDQDLSGTVNVADLANLAGNFGQNSGQVWINGDFDYNGNVNVSDLADLAGNFGKPLGG